VPASLLFNNLPYQKLRILIDSFLTKKYQNRLLKNFSNEKINFFESGRVNGIILNLNFFPDSEIKKIELICNSLISNYQNHNLNIDNGGLGKNSESSSKYYYLPNFKEKLTNEVSKLYNFLFSNKDLILQLKFLSGLNLKKENISVHISKVKGKLLSDEWHSDCFSHTAKSFLYLHNIEKNNSPFCFLKKSHGNKKLKMLNEKENASNILKSNNGEAKSGNEIWNKLEESNYRNEILDESDPIECSYPKGTLITCDTSGFHKKGYSDGNKERFMIGFVSNRGTMFEKFKSAFF
jgi:hypothetical protein